MTLQPSSAVLIFNVNNTSCRWGMRFTLRHLFS